MGEVGWLRGGEEKMSLKKNPDGRDERTGIRGSLRGPCGPKKKIDN